MVSADDNWVNCSFIHAQLRTVKISKGEKIANSLVPLLKSGFTEQLFRSGTMSYYAIPRRNHHVRPVFIKKISVFYFIFKNTLSLLQKPKEKGFTAVSKEMKKLDF